MFLVLPPMKKRIIPLLIIILFFISCALDLSRDLNLDDKEKGSLIINFNSQLSSYRIILPDINMTVETYDITGNGPASATFQQNDITNTTVNVSDLVAGSWDIHVDAKNPDGIIIADGSTNVIIENNNVVNATVIVTPLEGSGTVSLTVDWSDADNFTSSAIITGTLTPAGGLAQTISFTKNDKSATHSSQWDSGYYTLSIHLNEGSENAYYIDTLRIIYNETTSATINIFDMHGTPKYPEIKIEKNSIEIPSGTGSFDYGYLEVGSSSNAVSFLIMNIGEANLNLTGNPDKVVITGANASMFSVNVQPDPILFPLAASSFSIIFTPTSSGSKTATVSIPNDDQDENPYTFTLTGDGYDPPPASLLDNFNDGQDPNLWGGDYQAWHTVLGDEDVSISYDPVNRLGEHGYGFKINVEVTEPTGFGGVKIELADGGAAVDISNYEYLHFWIKASTNNFPLKIEMTNTNTGGDRWKAYLYITDYLDGGITTSWQQVKIPLDAFANIDDFSNINSIGLIFEHDYADACGFPKVGTVYIDDIGFDETFLGYVRIDHFGDNYGLNALGANGGSAYQLIDDGQPDSPTNRKAYHSFSFESSEYHNYSLSLSSVYDTDVADGGGWCGYFMIFGGGETGWDPSQQYGFSAYNKITLWVKAASNSQNPKTINIELKDCIATRVANIPDDSTTPSEPITTEWKKYTIDLVKFSGLYKNQIKQMNIIYQKSDIVDKGGDTSGILYFDEIQFEE